SRYETQPHRFSDYTDLVLRTRLDHHGLIGVGVYMNKVDHGFAQIREAIEKGADGVVLYSYNGTNNENVPRAEYFKRLREEIFTQPVEPPVREWKENATYGIVIGQAADGGKWMDGATVTLDGTTVTLTDATGFYMFNRILPGRHVVTLTRPDGSTSRAEVTVEVGRAARANFD